MRTLFIFTFLVLYLDSQAQIVKAEQRECSEIINELSYFWRLDSLGSNGFRLFSYELILKARLNTLIVDTLFKKFGKPNQTLKSQKDVTYLYYYLNPRKVPDPDYGSFGAIYYIGFTQKNNRTTISNISAWHLDL